MKMNREAWEKVRDAWFLVNKPYGDSPYICHYCEKPLKKEEVTLDHILQSGRYEQTRYDLSNLVPACKEDNNKRGQYDYEKFCRMFYPRLLRKNRLVRP